MHKTNQTWRGDIFNQILRWCLKNVYVVLDDALCLRTDVEQMMWVKT